MQIEINIYNKDGDLVARVYLMDNDKIVIQGDTVAAESALKDLSQYLPQPPEAQ